MVSVPATAVGGIAVYATILHLYLAYRLGRAEVEADTVNATEAQLAGETE